jgi:hypothetical protein
MTQGWLDIVLGKGEERARAAPDFPKEFVKVIEAVKGVPKEPAPEPIAVEP